MTTPDAVNSDATTPDAMKPDPTNPGTATLAPAAIQAMLAEHWPALALTCEELSPTHAVAALRAAPADLRPGEMLSGPTLFGVADAVLWFLCCGAAGRVEPLALTSELSIRFLRPARGSIAYGRATLDKAGGRTVVGTVRVWTDADERACAVAQGTYVLPARPGGS